MRIALCICPQWSVQTPSFAIGSLKSHIKNKDVEVEQFDLNIRTSLYTKEKNIEKNSFFDDEINNDEDFEFNQDFEIEENTRSPGWIRYQKRIK